MNGANGSSAFAAVRLHDSRFMRRAWEAVGLRRASLARAAQGSPAQPYSLTSAFHPKLPLGSRCSGLRRKPHFEHSTHDPSEQWLCVSQVHRLSRKGASSSVTIEVGRLL